MDAMTNLLRAPEFSLTRVDFLRRHDQSSSESLDPALHLRLSYPARPGTYRKNRRQLLLTPHRSWLILTGCRLSPGYLLRLGACSFSSGPRSWRGRRGRSGANQTSLRPCLIRLASFSAPTQLARLCGCLSAGCWSWPDPYCSRNFWRALLLVQNAHDLGPEGSVRRDRDQPPDPAEFVLGVLRSGL